MSKNLNIAFLLDFYGDILTPKQYNVIDLYYNEDLSLAEISEHCGITRQGVRDSIKRGEAILTEMEQKLKLASRFTKFHSAVEQIYELAFSIHEINHKYMLSAEIEKNSQEIKRLAKEILDEDSEV